MNVSRIIGIAVVVATVLEFITRGKLGPAGMVIALVIAVIISWNLPSRGTMFGTGNASGAPGPATAPGATDPYVVLGITPGCSDEELTRAYHALVKQWHPDQLEGMAAELRAHANQKLAEINQAFDLIRRSRRS